MCKTWLIIPLIISCHGLNPYEEIMNFISRKQLSETKTNMQESNDIAELTSQEIANRSLKEFPNYRTPDDPNYVGTVFCPIMYAKQDKAQEVNEIDYPWIARVIHSHVGVTPLICSAVALRKMIFITAARCIAPSKVVYTDLLYRQVRLKSRAFVMPSVPSHQMFDDIGFIVVHSQPEVQWETIPVMNVSRTDDYFVWFNDLSLKRPVYTAVGFVAEEYNQEIQRLYKLERLFVSNFLCNRITRMKPDTNDYWVPCYHPCTVEEHFNNSKYCQPFLGGVGHVLIDSKSELIGIATWACDYTYGIKDNMGPHLPVGLALPNSDSFFEDRACAIKIRDYGETKVEHGFYNTLCSDKEE